MNRVEIILAAGLTVLLIACRNGSDTPKSAAKAEPCNACCEADKRYGAPIAVDTFTMRGDNIHEFRVELLNHFPLDNSIIIREVTWATDTLDNLRLTIWFRLENEECIPADTCQWDKYTEF